MLRKQGGRRQVRRVLRRRPGQPAAGRPGHDRQHGPRIRRDLRHLPDRRRDAPLPRALRPAGRADRAWSRPTARSRGCSTTADAPRPTTPTRWSSTSSTVEPSLAGPKRPQDRVPLREAKAAFEKALKVMLDARPAPAKARHGRGGDRRQERAAARGEGAAAPPSAPRTRRPGGGHDRSHRGSSTTARS